MEGNEMRASKWGMTEEYKAALAQHEMRRAESMQQIEKDRLANRLVSLEQKVSSRYRHKTLENFKIDYAAQNSVKKIAQQFIATFPDRLKEGTCLMLLGKPGTGKTFIALILYQALARLNFSVDYEPSLQFLRKFQDNNFDSHASFQTVMKSYMNTQFLILDEVTEGFSGKSGLLADWEKQMLFTLIDARYHANLCTVVISNRSKEEMIERIGDRVVDRLSDKGLTLAFNWKSYRQSL
jgi:DNA replication protein DnaC